MTWEPPRLQYHDGTDVCFDHVSGPVAGQATMDDFRKHGGNGRPGRWAGAVACCSYLDGPWT